MSRIFQSTQCSIQARGLLFPRQVGMMARKCHLEQGLIFCAVK